MAKSQENGTTILLWLKGYQVGMVTENERKIIVEVRIKETRPVCPLGRDLGVSYTSLRWLLKREIDG